MATIYITSTYGSDDPTRATIPFLSAKAFLEAGHNVGVALLGEGVNLMKDATVKQIDGVGWPPLNDFLPKLIKDGLSIYVWGGCSVARAVTETDLEGKNAKFITPADSVDLTMAADKVLTF